jgi:hypothetical protein
MPLKFSVFLEHVGLLAEEPAPAPTPGAPDVGPVLVNPVPVIVHAKRAPGGAFRVAEGQALTIHAEAVPERNDYFVVDRCLVEVHDVRAGGIVLSGEAVVTDGRRLTYTVEGLSVGVYDVFFVTEGGSTAHVPSPPARLLVAPAR